jgi:hypothetical protein
MNRNDLGSQRSLSRPFRSKIMNVPGRQPGKRRIPGTGRRAASRVGLTRRRSKRINRQHRSGPPRYIGKTDGLGARVPRQSHRHPGGRARARENPGGRGRGRGVGGGVGGGVGCARRGFSWSASVALRVDVFAGKTGAGAVWLVGFLGRAVLTRGDRSCGKAGSGGSSFWVWPVILVSQGPYSATAEIAETSLPAARQARPAPANSRKQPRDCHNQAVPCA